MIRKYTLGLFTGVRTFTLTPQSNTITEFTIHAEFSGPLLPLFARSIPDMTQTVEDFAAGLKAYAEKASSIMLAFEIIRRG